MNTDELKNAVDLCFSEQRRIILDLRERLEREYRLAEGREKAITALNRDKETLWQELVDTQKALREVKEQKDEPLIRPTSEIILQRMEWKGADSPDQQARMELESNAGVSPGWDERLDAVEWSRMLNAVLRRDGRAEVDEGLLVAYLANAMVRGEDAGYAKGVKESKKTHSRPQEGAESSPDEASALPKED